MGKFTMDIVVNRLTEVKKLHPVEAYQDWDAYNDCPVDKVGCPTCNTVGPCATLAAVEGRVLEVKDDLLGEVFPDFSVVDINAVEAPVEDENSIVKRLEDIETVLAASPGLRDQNNALSRIRVRDRQRHERKFKKLDQDFGVRKI